MTGGKAMKLGDVLTMRNGKTVEVMNTDAEGRLILADALSFCVEHKPHRVLDLATLTGACMVALGSKVAGLFSNDEHSARNSRPPAGETGERVWRMPLDDDYKEQLKSHVADLKNIGGKWGGAVTAAKFLEQFVGSTPWIHLDIAGPSWCDSENSDARRRRDRLLRQNIGRTGGANAGHPSRAVIVLTARLVVNVPNRPAFYTHQGSKRHSIRRLLTSSVSRISMTSLIGRRFCIAHKMTSRFSRPCLKCSKIGSISGED